MISAIMAFALMTSVSVMAQNDNKKKDNAAEKAKTEACCKKDADKKAGDKKACCQKDGEKKGCCAKKSEPKQ